MSQVFNSGGAASYGLDLSVIVAVAVIGQIILATFLIYCLFRYNQMMILYGILVFTVLVVLGYIGYRLGTSLLSFFNIPMDYLSFSFMMWNLSVAGVAVVFFKGPLWLQQSYLVVLSSLMAFSFTTLPALVTWLLLGLLAVWGLSS